MARETPTIARCFGRPIALAFIAVLAVPHLAAGGPDVPTLLTEEEVVQRGLSRPALADLDAGQVGLARGTAVTARLWPNPTVSYSREETHGGQPASAEDYAWLTQSLDIAGRRRLHGQAAGRRVEAASDQAEARRIDVAAEIRERFYATLFEQRKVEVFGVWSRQMGRVAGTVAKREAAGDVSGYDRRRLDRERASAEARLQVGQAALERARERLSALIGEDTTPRAEGVVVRGELLPPADVRSLEDILTVLPARPDLRALDREVSAAELEARAAGRWWLPEVTVNGGLKAVDVRGDRATGFLAGLSVPLPLLDRSQGEALRAVSRARTARGQRAIEAAKAAGEVRGLWAEMTRLAMAARQLRQDAVVPSAALVRTAEAAYEGGEMDILELLDAHRGAVDAEVQTLELELAARRARIELERVTGGGL